MYNYNYNLWIKGYLINSKDLTSFRLPPLCVSNSPLFDVSSKSSNLESSHTLGSSSGLGSKNLSFIAAIKSWKRIVIR